MGTAVPVVRAPHRCPTVTDCRYPRGRLLAMLDGVLAQLLERLEICPHRKCLLRNPAVGSGFSNWERGASTSHARAFCRAGR